MKLMVPDITVPATGEKTLRQYKCANITSVIDNMSADLTIAVTNRRLIQHAEAGNSSKSQLIHNEIFIDNIGGFSFFRGNKKEKRRFGLKFFLLFILFAGLAGLAYWQSLPIFEFVSRSVPTVPYNDVFKFSLAGVPMLFYILIIVIINIKSRKFLLNMIIYVKGLKSFNLFSESEFLLESGNFILIPYLKETKTMISEIASLILDVQKFGADEVLKHIDAEDTAL